MGGRADGGGGAVAQPAMEKLRGEDVSWSLLVKGAQVQVFGNFGPEPCESRQSAPTPPPRKRKWPREGEVAGGRTGAGEGSPSRPGCVELPLGSRRGREDEEQLGGLGAWRAFGESFQMRGGSEWGLGLERERAGWNP